MKNKYGIEETKPRVGLLVYIPSEVMLAQYPTSSTHLEDTREYIKKHLLLTEPIVAPIVETRDRGDMVKVHYDGDNWWLNSADTYLVESAETLGSSLK